MTCRRCRLALHDRVAWHSGFDARRLVRYSILVLTLLLSAPASASEVTATRLDGMAIVGELRSWEPDQVQLSTPEGNKPLATSELLSLAWQTPAAPNKADATAATGQIELIDGSLIPADEFTLSGTQATATLTALLPTPEKTLTVSRQQLAAVRLRPLDSAAANHWREIRDAEVAADVLVLLKRNGKSLDYVEGVLGDVSPRKIEFKLDGEPLTIDREKVAGLIFYRRQAREDRDPRCILHGRDGLRAYVSQAELAHGLVKIETLSGAGFKWPLDEIHLADFSAGKLLYLSDMEPASERWTPLVGLPSDATLAAEYGRPRRNQSAYGGPLTLRPDDDLALPSDVRTRVFHKGLALRSRTELFYRVPPGFRRFTTIAGIDPSATARGNVRLEIYGDDRLLVEDDIAGLEPPRTIEIDIRGAKRLKILVDYGRNLDTGDWLNLCDAKILK
jgi:hypothetical protein